MSKTGSCSCGQVEFNTSGKPLFRLRCHCTICQKFNDADYADILIYSGKSIEAFDEKNVDFKSYKPKSPILRGTCINCSDPVIEKSVTGPKVWIVPVSTFSPEAQLPDVAADIFYKTRVADCDDTVPKYGSAFISNLVMVKHLLFAKFTK